MCTVACLPRSQGIALAYNLLLVQQDPFVNLDVLSSAGGTSVAGFDVKKSIGAMCSSRISTGLCSKRFSCLVK